LKGLHAYVLAADPTWIESSVGAYYPHVEKIIVSFDRTGRGWTGASIPVEECISRLRCMDGDRKMQFIGGCYSERVSDPMENDTLQRNAALAQATEGARWVLQLDTDEWLPDVDAFLEALAHAERLDLGALEWPMRVLYRKMSGGRILEVCSRERGDHFEYIAPVAVRTGVRLVHSRRTACPFLRAVARGDDKSGQLRRPLAEGERREALLDSSEAIIHNSWARSPSDLRRKLASWSHAGARAWIYYLARWLPSVWLWPWMKNLHPFFGDVWPALRVCRERLPMGLQGNPVSKERQRSASLPAPATGIDDAIL